MLVLVFVACINENFVSESTQNTEQEISVIPTSQIVPSSKEALDTITFVYHFKDLTEEKLRSDIPRSVAFVVIDGEEVPVKRIELFKNGSTRTTEFYDSSGKLLKTDIAQVGQ